MRAAVVRGRDGLVVNVIEVEDLSFPVEAGHTLHDALNAGPGWTWDGTIFIAPPPPPIILPAMGIEDVWKVLRVKGIVVDADVPSDRRAPV